MIKDRESFPTLSNKVEETHLVYMNLRDLARNNWQGLNLEKSKQPVHVSRFLGSGSAPVQKILQKMAGMPKGGLKNTITRSKSGEALRICGFPTPGSVQRGLEQLGIAKVYSRNPGHWECNDFFPALPTFLIYQCESANFRPESLKKTPSGATRAVEVFG